MFSHRAALSLLLCLCVPLAAGCAATPDDDEAASEAGGVEDEDVGDIESGVVDGWGAATKCKVIPAVEALQDPEIVISLDGLTLHLRDRAGSYDRVFPIGPGALEGGESLTPTSESTPKGVFYTGSSTAETSDGSFGYYYPCRIWWTDTDTGKKKPVFAGLPFIRLSGPPTAGYGIHGPVDNFTLPTGGTLRHGYVSHGCLRMSAEDIVEVYGRIHLHPKTPVRIQKEVEIDEDGFAVDVEKRWIGSACAEDADCNFDGGMCRIPEGGAQGSCTRSCTKTCPDRASEAPTFCVPDPAGGGGICVPKPSGMFNDSCARYEERLVYVSSVYRPDHSAKANVCRPPQ